MPANDSTTPIEITDYFLWQSGGHCMVDVFNLSNERSLGVTDECIVIFKGLNAGADDEDGYDYGESLVNLIAGNPDLIVDEKGSAIKAHDSGSITLNDGTKYNLADLLKLENTNA